MSSYLRGLSEALYRTAPCCQSDGSNITNSSKSILLVNRGLLYSALGNGYLPTHRHKDSGGKNEISGQLHRRGTLSIAVLFKERVTAWCPELKGLSNFTQSEPHTVYAAHTHGLRGCRTYVLRTLTEPNPGSLQLLQEAIDSVVAAAAG